MDIAFRHRLGEMVTETKSMSSSEPKEMSKSNTLVAEIASDTKLAFAQRLAQRQEKKLQNPCLLSRCLKYEELVR